VSDDRIELDGKRIVQDIDKLIAELDRLRAAVQTALGVMLKHMVDCHEGRCAKCAAFGEVYPHLGPPQLDVSGDIGGGGSASFTCPRCSHTSHHPTDVEMGYCGHCHAWTRDDGDPEKVP